MSQTFVVDTSKSKYAKLKPVPLNSVKLTDSFWANRIKTYEERYFTSSVPDYGRDWKIG